MALVNATYLQQYSGVLRWLDENGNSVKTTSLSDTSVGAFAWGQDGQYFYTASPYSTGRIEKWARDGTAYTWRYVKDNITLIAPLSNGDLAICFSDDAWILGYDDGAVDHSNVGSDMYQFGVNAIAVDSSDNVYITATDYTYYTYGMYCYVFDNTLTLSTSFQVTTGSYDAKSIVVDSSGNIFIAWNYHVTKFNSSGTQQWDYDPTGITAGTVTDLKIANGYIYCCVGNRVACVTDNGGSYTEEWNVDCSTDGYYGINKIAVTSDQVICFPLSGTYNIHARDALDGTEDTNFTPYDITGAIIVAGVDPLATATVGAFEVTHQIQFSRWVKTGGYEIIGHINMPLDVTVRGYGNEIIDKLYTKGNYSYIGTPTPRYENFAMVGDPMAEEFGIKAYAAQTSTYNVCVDDEYNQYLMVNRYYTSGEATTNSDGYYTSAGNYWSVQKYDNTGTFVWETNIIIGTLAAVTIDRDYAYIYTLSGYTEGAICKWSCATGEEYTDTYWPIDFLDVSDGKETNTFKVGRDNKLYCAMYDASDSSLPYLYKWNLDGTPATNWSTPYAIPQGGSGTSPNCIDVTSDGTVAIGCVKLGENGDAIKVVLADKTLDWEGLIPDGDNAYGADYILIHDTDKYIIAETYSGIRKITGETSGICDVDWLVSTNSSTGEGYLYNPFWSYDQDYFYAHCSLSSADWSMRKYAYSDGSIVWKAHGDDDTLVTFAGVAPIPVPAWAITVTFGSNGTVKTYYGGGDIGGVALTSGDVVLAEAGNDFTFEFVGDTGYYVDEVTVDSVNLGYRSSYTFENVLNNHTIYVTFGTGFPSGPFTMTYELTGGLLETITCGHLSESYDLTMGKLQWYMNIGALSETYAITGEGYLPWEISLLYLINAYRSDNSVPSLTVHDWLVDGAEYAVADLIANGSLTLTAEEIMGQDGANYPYMYAGILPGIADIVYTPQDIFDAWIGNPTIEAMIINTNYDEVGIYVEEYDGNNYICVVFAQWHYQYTVERMTENFEITYSLGDDVPFFDFMSAETYATFLENSASIYLPRYRAKLGTYEIPNITAFTYRLGLGTPSYLEVHAKFDKDVFDYIETHQDDGLIVESIVNYGGSEVINEVVNVEFTTYSKVAGEPQKLMIAGYSTLNYYESTVALRNVMVRTRDEQGKTRFRCSQPDFYIRPGCTVTYSTYSIVAEKVIIFVTDGLNQYMEITGE